ncbi:MAG: hypothetical protein ACOC1P_04245, partial [Minisyncoccales bacterium]
MNLKDKKFRLPRYWSNQELRKFSHLFSGKVINVSAWKDIDKQGNRYKDYFSNCSEYYLSNIEGKGKGIQGLNNEFKLDLEENLNPDLENRFDVVFNHTTLEH